MKRILFCCLFIVSMLSAFGQTVSNEGRDFWATFPTHDKAGTDAQIVIFVTSKFDTEATVTCGSYSQTLPVLANAITSFNIPRPNAYISISEFNVPLQGRGIHITAPLSSPKVAVYAHIYANARSAASLILPVEALGQSYYSMNYTQTGTRTATVAASNFLTLVAVENNTNLIIHSISGQKIIVPTLNIGDVFEYVDPRNSTDLTGTFVEVDKTQSKCARFAAFSGSSSLSISCSGSILSQDPLYQQLYAPNSWGKIYGIVPFKDRRYILRVLSKENDTHLIFKGVSYALQAGQFFDSGLLTEPLVIAADKPVCVAQYSLTQSCSGAGGNSVNGDPEMVILNPVEFGLKNITMFSSDKEAIKNKYINVYIKSDAIASFKVNGTAPSEPWFPMPDDATYSYSQIETKTNSLTLTANQTFNAMAYGFGNVESYAYSAGTSLAAFQFLTIKDKTTNKKLDNACVGASYELSIRIRDKATQITWKFSDGTNVSDPDPQPIVSLQDGETVYTYTFSEAKTFTDPGNQQVTVQVNSLAGSECSVTGDSEYKFDILVNPLPVTDFNSDAVKCSGTSVNFTDTSNSQSSTIILDSWNWDFGDANAPADKKTSTDQNPTHIYSVPGKYTVTLSAGVAGGCFSSTLKEIIVYPTPVAKFKAAANLCIDREVTLVDESSIAQVTDAPSKITKWIWDFGDGSSIVTATTNQVPPHTYAAPGPYYVTLIVVSDHSCESLPFDLLITIVPLPIADFILPGFCLDDKDATFINKSLNSDSTVNNLSYSWNFGDPGTPDNISTAREGKHEYKKIGKYTVTLTIRNEAEGCTVTKIQEFTVNGSVKTADFTIANNNECVKNDIIINNTSSAFAGGITKIDVYKDYIKFPTVFFSIDNPTAADIHLQYPTFGGDATRQFKIRMIAYSGEALTCQKETSHIVTVKPSPQLIFNAIPSVCLSDGTVNLTQASETSGMTGTFVYSGLGVNSTGLFNPLVAGVGVHQVTYTFTSSGGCSESIIQTIVVLESPVVDAGADMNIFEGGELPMNATTTSTGTLTYKWSPAVGLSDDTILNPVVKPLVDAIYTLTVTNESGCTASDAVKVTVLKDIKPFNTFSPNGDGINDVWTLPYINSYPKVTVEIFNRNGDRVFFSKGYTIPFDGKYKGEVLPVGTYYYLINPGFGRKTVAGDVTIIR